MATKRWPVIFLVGGSAIKALLIGLTKMVDSPELVSLLINYDPGAVEVANRGTSLLFDGKGIAPGPGEAKVFEVLLVVGFGIESLLMGFFFQGLQRWRKSAIGG